MKNKFIYLFPIVVLLINISALVYIKKTEFPFISLSYKETADDFNSNELDLRFPLSQEFKDKVSDDLSPVLEGEEDIFLISSVLAEYTRSYLVSKMNIVDNVDEILEAGGQYPAICSGYSKLLAAVAQALGYWSRVIWLEGHTVSEIYFPDYGWVLADASGNLIFQDNNGKYLSLVEITDNFSQALPKRLAPETDNDPDFISSGKYSVYEDNPTVVVIEGPRIFDFFVRTKSPLVLLNYVFTGKNVAKGIQYIGQERNKLGNLREHVILLFVFNFLSFIILIVYLKKNYVRNRRNLGLQ